MNRNAELAVSTGERVALSDRFGGGALDRASFIAAIAVFLVTMASFFGHTWWLFELLTHFRLHIAAASGVLLLWELARRSLVTAMLAAIALAANASPLIPYVIPGTVEAEASASRVRLMSANVLNSNSDYSALRAAIREEDPDIVGLLEVDQTWLDELSPVTSEYSYSVLRPEEGAYGLALFSRLPVRELATSPYVEGGYQTAIMVELKLEQVPVTLMLTHVRAPSSPAKARLRNVQLERIAEMLNGDGKSERVLIGDLNTTPWSPYYQQLEADAQMVNAAIGQGYQPTWPSGFGILKVPIDHCLVSDGLRVQHFRPGPGFGSDHLPIVVDLGIADIRHANISADRELAQTP